MDNFGSDSNYRSKGQLVAYAVTGAALVGHNLYILMFKALSVLGLRHPEYENSDFYVPLSRIFTNVEYSLFIIHLTLTLGREDEETEHSVS
jgi:hypothetical protein